VMKYVDIHEGLESTLMLVQHQLKMAGGLITIEKNYAQLPLVECFANQLNQVFMNLLNNAIDALKSLDSPGKIIIQTTQPTLDMVEIWIQDNGPGIVPSNIARIFDPFFTTKPVGQGVGLGLSVSYQIIQMHEGQLICDSTLGQGTTFKIVIPLSQTPVQPLV
jgi:two-component system, NtrC family, sensor kinase